VSKALKELWRKPISAPTIEILKDHLAKPLTDEEKLPISKVRFNRQIRGFHSRYSNEEVTAEHLNQIFRVSETEFTSYDSMVIERIILGTESYDDGTENSFIGLWNDNIGVVLEKILNGVAVRDSNHRTSTALKQPDYGFLINGKYCLFRGEEKPPGSLEDPRNELVLKLIWTYDPLMYILGEWTCPPFVRASHFRIQPIMQSVPKSTSLRSQSLLKLCHSSTATSKLLRIESPALYVYFVYAESSRGWPNSFAMMASKNTNLSSGPFYYLAVLERALISYSADGLTKITIGKAIEKIFLHPDAAIRVSHLTNIYNLLLQKKVPNTDILVRSSTEESNCYVVLKPRGIDALPRDGREAYAMIACVLQALTVSIISPYYPFLRIPQVMHSDPPIYHRDIRPSNILKQYNDDTWFLIDWSDSATPPTLPASLSDHNHSPRIHDANHGAEVDIWAVGYCLTVLARQSRVHDAPAVKRIGMQWQEEETLTADAALAQIKVLNLITLFPRMCYLHVDMFQAARHLFIDPKDEQLSTSSPATARAKPSLAQAGGAKEGTGKTRATRSRARAEAQEKSEGGRLTVAKKAK